MPLGGFTPGRAPLGGGSPAPDTTTTTPTPTGTQRVVLLELNGFGAGWTDVSDDVTGQPMVIGRRGYQSTAPDALVAAPGPFTCGLDNSAFNASGMVGRYSPDHVNCLPGFGLGIRLRCDIVTNGVTHTRFIGFVQRIEPTLGLFEDQTVAIQAATWFQLASTTRASGIASQVLQRGDQLLTTLIARSQFPPPALAFDVGTDVYPYALWDLDPSTATIMDGIISATKSGLDRCHEKADGTVVFESKQLREIGADTNVLTVTDTPPAGHPFLAIQGLSAYRSLDSIYNHFTVTAHPGRVDLSPVVLYAYQTTGSTMTIQPGQSVTITGQYVDPSQQAQYVAGFSMIDNGSGRLLTADYAFTSAPSGAGDDLTFAVTVMVSFDVRQATFVITNTGTVAANLARLQCRGRGIYNYETAVGSQTASGSQAIVGQLTIDVDCPYQSDPVFAENAARYMAARYSSQLTQIDQGVQVFVAAGAEVDLDALLSLEISSPVGISETMSGLSAGDYWVNAIQEEYDERNNLLLTLYLARRDPNRYWELGVAGRSEIGQTTFLAYL